MKNTEILRTINAMLDERKKQIGRLTRYQIGGLTQDQIGWLTRYQIGGLSNKNLEAVKARLKNDLKE